MKVIPLSVSLLNTQRCRSVVSVKGSKEAKMILQQFSKGLPIGKY